MGVKERVGIGVGGRVGLTNEANEGDVIKTKNNVINFINIT